MTKFNFRILKPDFLARMGIIGLAISSPNAVAQTPAAPAPAGQTTSAPSTTPISAQKAAAPAANPFPLSSTISYDSLRIMAYSGQSEQAIKLAEEYLKTHENSSIRVLLARMLAWNGKYDEAKAQLQIVLSKRPGDYDANDCLSDIDVWNGNYSQAIDDLTNALKYNPQSDLAEKREIIRCKMLVSQGHSDQAIQVAQDYLKTHDSVDMSIYLATQLSANKQYDDAIKILENILNKKASNTDASNALANVEISAGNYPKALEVIDNGLKYSPQNSGLNQNRKLVLSKLNPSTPQTAAPSTPSLFAKMTLPVISQPKQQTSGVTYDQLNKMAHNGQRQKAIKLAEESLKQNDNTDIRILLGLMLSWEGRYSEARIQLELVLKKKPDSLDAAKGLANVELWSDNNKRALVVINNGLKYHPHDKDLLKQRDTALGIGSKAPSYAELRKMYTSGQTEKAKQIAQEYLKKNENVDIRLLLGLMDSWDKDYDDAQTQLEIVLKNKPGYTDASLALADVYIYQNNNLSALKVINNGLKYHPTDTDLRAKRASVIQSLNQSNTVAQGAGILSNLTGVTGPSTPGGKLNAFSFDQEVSYVDDLKQTWKITSLGYERYTPYGPIIFTFNQFDRFKTAGNQSLVEAYPHLFNGAYMYLGYGYSSTSYIARNYIGIEPFFSLPLGLEASAGERILQFQGGTTHLYTGSFAKYYGNYWFSLRPYYTNTSASYYFTTRRYFSSPDSYIELTFGGGSGPNTFNLLDINSISSNRSRSIRLDGHVPLTEDIIFTWLAEYSSDHYPNGNTRQETDLDAGFIWRF